MTREKVTLNFVVKWLFFDRVFVMSVVFYDVVDEVECLFSVTIAGAGDRIPVYFRKTSTLFHQYCTLFYAI